MRPRDCKNKNSPLSRIGSVNEKLTMGAGAGATPRRDIYIKRGSTAVTK